MAGHQAHRLEIELALADANAARPMMDRVSALGQPRLAELLARVCGELSEPGCIDRVDRLEIDLGRIEADDFEDEFLARLEPALREALAAKLRAGRARLAAAAGARELLECHALSGSLPWWADHGAPDLLVVQLRLLLAQAADQLTGLLAACGDDLVALGRLARLGVDIDLLSALVGGRPAAEALQTLEHVLLRAGAVAHPAAAAALVRPLAMLRVGRAPPPSSAAWRDDLLAALPRAALVALQAQASRDPAHAAPARNAASARPGAAWQNIVERILASSTLPSATSVGSGQARVDTAPANGSDASGPQDAAAASMAMRAGRAGYGELDEHRAESEAETETEVGVESDDLLATLAPSHGSPRAKTSADGARSAGLYPNPVRAARPRAAAFAALDELEVDNAGLVVLWPFLEQFFGRLGLLNPQRRFIDADAAQLAVALLAQLAYDDPTPAEFRLPLAKLLCGLEPDAPFEPRELPTEKQSEECLHLLAAAVAHAPVLRDMAPQDFRATFVLRQGALTVRAGAWLLQVERQPQDALLDRFSWSWAWVKLPWMVQAMQVAW